MSAEFAGTIAEKSRDREKIIDNKRFTCYYNVCKITQGMSEIMLSEAGNAQGVSFRQVERDGPATILWNGDDSGSAILSGCAQVESESCRTGEHHE